MNFIPRFCFALTATDRWNGNISEWVWAHEATSYTYRFAYDGVNRLTSAVSTGNYNEKGITYDRNGNIKTMQRNAGSSTTMVDNLTYTYAGNKLTSLSEAVSGIPTGDIFARGSAAAGSYTYDANGNMVTDSRKSLQFTYNFLNLLNEVRSGSTVKAKYTWLADGSKLRVRNNSTTGFDYLGSLTYTSSSSGLMLETAQFAGGVIRSGNSQEINYFITDHLGSVRAIVDASGNVKERNDYYAFGAKHVRSTYPQNSNRFDFNGKEEQTTGDLDYLDYGARMYDPMIGRWFNTDPLAEKFYPLSQYNYALNNPVFFIDPDGMAADGYILNNYGEIKRLDNTGGDKYDVLYSSDKQNSLRVNDTSILPGLASTGYSSKDKNGRYTLTWAWGNPDDLRSLFLFASHNSSVEWRFSRFDIGFGDQYALGTKHDESHSPNPEQMGFTLESEIAFVHNHPTPWQTLREEIRSMGWLDTGRKDPATGRPLIDRQGDTWNIWDDQINGGPRANTHSYAYFPHSGNLWHIGGMYGVSYIRNINGDSRRFFFGTLNHK